MRRVMWWDLLAGAAPFVVALGFYALLEWGPKDTVDPQCGTPTWVVIAYLPVLGLPALISGLRARSTGKGWVPTAGIAVITLALTVLACLGALYISTVHHKCGE